MNLYIVLRIKHNLRFAVTVTQINKDDAADLILDVSPFLNQKESAALCHKTQNALFVRRRSEMAGRQLTIREVMLSVESLHRIFGSEEDELTKLFSSFIIHPSPFV
jgi:LmbE family N-acetylglucosaminyl deacetylase